MCILLESLIKPFEIHEWNIVMYDFSMHSQNDFHLINAPAYISYVFIYENRFRSIDIINGRVIECTLHVMSVGIRIDPSRSSYSWYHFPSFLLYILPLEYKLAWLLNKYPHSILTHFVSFRWNCILLIRWIASDERAHQAEEPCRSGYSEKFSCHTHIIYFTWTRIEKPASMTSDDLSIRMKFSSD